MSKDKALIHDLSCSVSFGRLSLKGKVFWPMLLTKADDQGRGIAEPDALKWKVCPNVEEITISDIPEIVGEMESDRVGLLYLYQDSRGRELYQIIRWWQPEIGSGSYLQWARPSEYEAPEGWVDRVRIQPGRGKEQITENWDHPGGFAISVAPTPDEALAQDKASMPPIDEAGIPPTPIIQPNPTQPNSKGKDDLGANAPHPYLEIRDAWIDLFPDKPKPREDNKTLRGKAKTRWKSDHFREHWREAMTRASRSTFCKSGGWFDLGWFLKNGDNYEKCLNGNYDDGNKAARASPGSLPIGPDGRPEPKGWAAARAVLAREEAKRGNGG